MYGQINTCNVKKFNLVVTSNILLALSYILQCSLIIILPRNFQKHTTLSHHTLNILTNSFQVSQMLSQISH